MSPLIWARDLTKRYRIPSARPGFRGAVRQLFAPRYEEKIAVRDLNLTIEAGESVACLGPNGAGKSTTIKMLTGLLVPSGGELLVRGVVPHEHRQRNAQNVSVIFGQRTQLWWDLPVIDSLRLLGDIYQVPADRFRSNLDMCVDLLEIEPLLRLPARSLSLGQRMRCDLAAAFLHEPALLFLDEPTIGLDIAVKERVRKFIRKMNKEEGVTVLLTSHDLGDIEGLCDRILIIDKGRLLFDGSPSALGARFGQERVVHLALKDSVDSVEVRCNGVLSALGARIEQLSPREALVFFDPARSTAAAVIGALLPLVPTEDLRVTEPSMEAVIRKIYDGDTQEPFG